MSERSERMTTARPPGSRASMGSGAAAGGASPRAAMSDLLTSGEGQRQRPSRTAARDRSAAEIEPAIETVVF